MKKMLENLSHPHVGILKLSVVDLYQVVRFIQNRIVVVETINGTNRGAILPFNLCLFLGGLI
jgi:hypothetical protein